MRDYKEIKDMASEASHRYCLAWRAAQCGPDRGTYDRMRSHSRNLVIDHAGQESWQAYFIHTGDVPNSFEWAHMSSMRCHQYTLRWLRHMLVVAHAQRHWYFGTAAWVTVRALLATRIRQGRKLDRRILLPKYRKDLEQFLKM